MKLPLLAFIALSVSGFAEAETYWKSESLSGQAFLDAFQWQTFHDPTNGRVNYVDKWTAQAEGLASVSGNKLTLRADHWTHLDPSGPGRNSFRLKSNKQYFKHVAVFDIGHMPEGCGTWPAISRATGDNWPNNGEIDIVEGVNNKIPNQSTLHTNTGCQMQSSRWMTGTSLGNNCDVYATGNVGCPVHLADSKSFGPNFNNVGGGWYAIDRGYHHVAIYFWARDSPYVPSDVRYPGETVNPSNWGTPAAYFTDAECNFATHLGSMNYIINLDFCGDWAGSVYKSDGCPWSSCVDWVNYNPGAFSNAYFEFNSMTTYGP